MNLSRISRDSGLGRLLRLPLDLLPPTAVVPVLQGKLRGARWITGAGTHGCWLGSYEYAKRRRFEHVVERGQVVWDIGAHAGFYTLLASRLAGPEGRVVAVEPLTRNFGYLQRHLRMNGCANVTPLQVAVSDATGVARFDPGPESSMAHLDPEGTLEVRTTTLDHLLAEGFPVPDVIKMDIEGAEAAALRGARAMLADARPAIFLATHSQQLHAECTEILQEAGYGLESIGEDGVLSSNEIFARIVGAGPGHEESPLS